MEILTHKEARERQDAMRRYCRDGHTAKEVAEKFGTSENYAMRICRGIHPGNQYTNGLFDQEGNAISIINERTPGFEYAGNFTGCDGYVDLRCKKCGTILHRSMITVRHSNVSCDICKATESEQRRKEREEKKQKEKRLKEADREERKRMRRASRKAEQLSMKKCLCCGELFVPLHIRTAYCSDECRNKIMNARAKDKRIKLMRHVVKDNNITLEKLYDRDSGICALCGNKCDWNDYHVRDSGAFIAMDMYPSIDHIIPLSKGGAHSWENVQLACRGCNSRKGANVIPSLSA